MFTITVANSLFSKQCDLTVETQAQVSGFTAYLEEKVVGPPGMLQSEIVFITEKSAFFKLNA